MLYIALVFDLLKTRPHNFLLNIPVTNTLKFSTSFRKLRVEQQAAFVIYSCVFHLFLSDLKLAIFEIGIIILFSNWIICAPLQGHGYLKDPPARNSIWREGFNNPVNDIDRGLNCGGWSVSCRVVCTIKPLNILY